VPFPGTVPGHDVGGPRRPERLERPDPVNPCGVARVLVLLTDGTGPLYNPAVADRMSDAVWWIADGLALGAGEVPER